MFVVTSGAMQYNFEPTKRIMDPARAGALAEMQY